MGEYVVEPDGTVSWDPGPDDFSRIRDEERDLIYDSES